MNWGTSMASEHIRVLVVDDNAHVRTMVRAVLSAAGMEVRESADGQQALQLLKQWRPDIAMVDFEMPSLNGAQFTRKVRESPDRAIRGLPILMMTAHADKTRVTEAREAGVNGLIAKPLTIGSIMGRIEKVLAAAGAHATVGKAA